MDLVAVPVGLGAAVPAAAEVRGTNLNEAPRVQWARRFSADHWIFVPTHHWLGGVGIGLILGSLLACRLLLGVGIVLLAFDVICHLCGYLRVKGY